MEHPILNRIQQESFTPFGWFSPADMGSTKFIILIGNAGPAMFRRFCREGGGIMDDWTRRVVNSLAQDLGATAAFPFDAPYLPFQHWARAAGNIYQSPLGLNIHKVYGLWHAYRAALLFPTAVGLPRPIASLHPCESCRTKPCLSACPVSAFNGRKYEVDACIGHLHSRNNCTESGCLARLACPVGVPFRYEKPQMQFHMNALKAAHELRPDRR